MMSHLPFDHNYFIGYVNQVFPDFVRVHFPSSVLLNKFIHSGEEFNAGLVGNYVTIEGENHGFLGKILELSLPEKERLHLNEKDFQKKDFHPIGRIEILLSFDYFNPEKIGKGLSAYPNIGSKVFVSSAQFIQKYFRGFGVKPEHSEDSPVFEFGTLTLNSQTRIEVSQQALFGRHCAIVGTTGGGKSWTVSKCIEEIIKSRGKTILIDATGEYSVFDGNEKVAPPAIIGNGSFFHYSNMTIEDIFVLLRPGGQVQSPKLLDAIKSLKIVGLLNTNIDGDAIAKIDDTTFRIKIDQQTNEDIKIENGIIIKNGQHHRPYNRIYYRFIEQIESIDASFDITKLPWQIHHECVQEISFNDPSRWGNRHEQSITNCTSLILRTNSFIHNPHFKNVFGINQAKEDGNELVQKIVAFLESDDCLLRIGFEQVGYEFQAREILANSIGKFLILKAREGIFKTKPIVLFIDEAHQYLNKHVKDEYFEATRLNAYDQIAKEGRKYGLFICLATQMPRDIPTGTLSQMGTFIVHRLIMHNSGQSEQ
ncbi:MAG: ATP-binding protein [Saprospiraceae bacterium]